MRVLFLSRWFPYPPDNGSKIRIFNLIRQLSGKHDVALLAFSGPADALDASAVSELQQYCSSIEVHPYPGFDPDSTDALGALFSLKPRSLRATYSPEMSRAIAHELGNGSTDLIVASEIDMIPYVLEHPGIPALLDDLELGTLRCAAPGEGVMRRARRELMWLKWSRYLQHSLPRFTACTVVSEPERQLIRTAIPGYAPLAVIPNAVDVEGLSGCYGDPEPESMVMCGSLTFGPNLDAARYFLERIYPRLQSVVPQTRLRFTGDRQGVELGPLAATPGVEFTGYLPDVRPVVARSWVSLVPLRVGGGTRLKILESMALGTPVVSTSKGAEGLDVTSGQNILIADEPSEFARCIWSVLRSPELRTRLSQAGQSLVRSAYDWNPVGAAFLDLVDRVVPDARGAETRSLQLAGGPSW